MEYLWRRFLNGAQDVASRIPGRDWVAGGLIRKGMSKQMTRWMWLWGGKCLGYRSRNSLFTFHGLHVGSFRGNIIFAADGTYLGEVFHEKRLITKVSNKCLQHDGFSPSLGKGRDSRKNAPSLPIPRGYEDFPDPGSFRPSSLQLIDEASIPIIPLHRDFEATGARSNG